MSAKSATHFVLVSTSTGIWMGRVALDAVTAWINEDKAITLYDVRSLIPQPDPRSGRINIMIGSPYFTDSPQLELIVRPFSIEKLGEIQTDKNGNKTCPSRQTLFSRYLDALTKWRASLANVEIPSPATIIAIKNANQRGKPK